MARDTTPFNCEHYRSHSYPDMQRYCWGLENTSLRNEAHRRGRLKHYESMFELGALDGDATDLDARGYL